MAEQALRYTLQAAIHPGSASGPALHPPPPPSAATRYLLLQRAASSACAALLFVQGVGRSERPVVHVSM